MNIIYIADIHGAFSQVKDLLAATDAQIYIVAGDLIDRPFFTEEMSARYRGLQSSLARLQYRLGPAAADMDDFVESVLERSDLSPDIIEQAREYREATVRARRVLQQKYKVLESILSLKRNSMVLCLPGNYDMDLQYTSLHGRDLHRHWYHAAELRVAGYGGADVATPGIPQRYSVPYKGDRAMSEMARFFKETNPDIVVTHKPAHGVHDHVAPMGESGSTELRRFCEENLVPLCLTGHIHDQWGFEEMEGTIYLNPSNFGEVHLPNGQISEGGFFYSIGTKGRQIDRVVLSKLVRGTVHEVVSYTPGDPHWVRKVIDEERFGALLRGKNHEGDTDPGRPSIREQIRRNMRWYFPGRADENAKAAAAEEIALAQTRLGEYGFSTCADFLENEDSPADSPRLDVVVYARSGGPRIYDEGRSGTAEIPSLIKAYFMACQRVRVVDWIDLDRVERALRSRDYECDETLRFAAYRCFAKGLDALPPDEAGRVERELNSESEYLGEMEGTGWAYMEIFRNVASRVETMKIFENRMRELGITAPEAYKRRIRESLHGGVKREDKKTD